MLSKSKVIFKFKGSLIAHNLNNVCSSRLYTQLVQADQFAYQDDMLIFYHQPSLEEDKTLKPTICTPLLTHLNTKFHIPKVPNVLDLARTWMKFPQRILRQNQIHWPSSTPESGMSLDTICDTPNLKADMTEQAVLPQQRVFGLSPSEIPPEHLFLPFTNPSCGILMAWQYTGTSTKSAAELTRLAAYLRDPLFDPSDLDGFNPTREHKLLYKYLQDRENPFHEENGWQESVVKICLPKEKKKWAQEDDAPELEIPGVHHRSLVDIISGVFEDEVFKTYHTTPFRRYWKPSDDSDHTVRLYSEAYSSDAYIDAYNEVNNLPREPGDELEHTVASLMLWSDSTHLANFGNASIWPFYVLLGNQSKYTRGKPTSMACHHLAYIPTLPDDIQEVYISLFGEAATSANESMVLSSAVVTESHSEFFLDFLHIWQTIQKKNQKFTKWSRVDDNMRCNKVNLAQELIFQHGIPINSERIESVLGEHSVIPTRCAMPVFQGLLSGSHNTIILDLIFALETWHAYAKLHLHTDDTLKFFDDATITLSQAVHKSLKTTCELYDTTELPQEEAACGRRTAALASKMANVGSQGLGQDDPARAKYTGPKRKKFNLTTYKYHALGDYPDTIRQFGTTDSYSTQLGELQHQCAKQRFPQTSKHHLISQMTHQDARKWLLTKISQQRKADISPITNTTSNKKYTQQLDDNLPYTNPSTHYHIAKSSRDKVGLTKWLGDLDFIPHLKNHLLGRLLGVTYKGDEIFYTDKQCGTVKILKNKLYWHQVLRLNYTTYDLRREQDSINPRTHPDIMVLAHEDPDETEEPHPYWYTRVIKIFHINVKHHSGQSKLSEPQQMDVLWVRWFARDTSTPTGWAAKRWHRVGFMDGLEPGAFGFLDPDVVIRGIHLIPAFAYGRTDEYLPPSITRQPNETNEDWAFFDVNIFVDCDMFMRYRGGGVGHKATREWDSFLQKEPHSSTDHKNEPAQVEGEGDDGIEISEGWDTEEESDEEQELEGENDKEEAEVIEDEGAQECYGKDKLGDEEVLDVEGFAPL
ncbi:hypothetical protein SERLA73DRAFT_155586 [Serpula lacrymans var. lacrymans S7.3]|uniref:Uncharacterized protein n=1 Tax=Serpula lacrymans var. lacrymans (strain S7.3) TaxID=936435 RepID=F8Q9Z0_SERL3|nr:hypothetical protein SERLA73DRAFT_155586 [Serpula lacrymans var. lacrymans S7.3]